MNALEQRFLETFPNILRDLTDEIRKLRIELEEERKARTEQKPEE